MGPASGELHGRLCAAVEPSLEGGRRRGPSSASGCRRRRPGPDPEGSLWIRHGTTLIAALVAGDVLLIGQIGDGGVLLVGDGGEVECPFSSNPLEVGGETDSLASAEMPLLSAHDRGGAGRPSAAPGHRRADQRLCRRRSMARLRPQPGGPHRRVRPGLGGLGPARLARSLLGAGQWRRHHARGRDAEATLRQAVRRGGDRRGAERSRATFNSGRGIPSMALAIGQSVLAEMSRTQLVVKKKLGEGGQGRSTWSRDRMGPRP